MNTLLKSLLIILLPSVAFAYEVRFNTLRSQYDFAPEYVIVYMCDKPITQVAGELGHTATCDGKLQTSLFNEAEYRIQKDFVYETDNLPVTVYIRSSVVLSRVSKDGVAYNVESDLSQEISATFELVGNNKSKSNDDAKIKAPNIYWYPEKGGRKGVHYYNAEGEELFVRD